MAGFMHDIIIKKIAFVKQAANKRSFLLFKSASEASEALKNGNSKNNENNESEEKVMKEALELLKTAGYSEADSKALVEKVGEEVAKSIAKHHIESVVEGIKDAAKAAEEKAIDEIAAKKEAEEAKKSADNDTDILAKVSDPGLQAYLRKQEERQSVLEKKNEVLQKEVTDSKAKIAAQEVSKTENMLKSVAKKYSFVGACEDDIVQGLRKTHEAGEEAFNFVVGLLETTDRVMKSGAIFDESGSTVESNAGTDPGSQIQRLISNAVEKSDGKLSKTDALAKVAKENPSLYGQYRRMYASKDGGADMESDS